MTWDEIAAFKRFVTADAAFADRVSLKLAWQIAQLRQTSGDSFEVLTEISCLENETATSTKSASQFRHAPLAPFWHKHFTSHRHTYRNICERWNVARGDGNRDLTKMVREGIIQSEGKPELLANSLAYRFVIGGLEERSSSGRMTGDWIIFAKHHGRKYYLDLATHSEGTAGEEAFRLFERIKSGSACEFPFLFADADLQGELPRC